MKKQERRDRQRYPEVLSVECVLRPKKYPASVTLRGRTQDISAHGISIISGARFSDFGLLEIEFILPLSSETVRVKAEAKVRWERPLKKELPFIFITGLAFTRLLLKDKRKLYAFLDNRRLRTKFSKPSEHS